MLLFTMNNPEYQRPVIPHETKHEIELQASDFISGYEEFKDNETHLFEVTDTLLDKPHKTRADLRDYSEELRATTEMIGAAVETIDELRCAEKTRVTLGILSLSLTSLQEYMQQKNASGAEVDINYTLNTADEDTVREIMYQVDGLERYQQINDFTYDIYDNILRPLLTKHS